MTQTSDDTTTQGSGDQGAQAGLLTTSEANPRARQARGDKSRDEQVTERRRKRQVGADGDPSLRRFGVSTDILDTEKFVYRSVADDGSRLIQLTQHDDYDFVTAKGEKASSADADGVLRYQSGTIDGRPQYTYLLRKLKQFADEDRRVKSADIDAKEAKALSQHTGEEPDQSYTPKR